MEGIALVKNSGLHDFEVVSLRVDYAKATVTLSVISPLINHVSNRITICISDFIDFSVSHKEPWGSGKYIFTSDVLPINSNTDRLEIQLNSGDTIVIDYRKAGGIVSLGQEDG